MRNYEIQHLSHDGTCNFEKSLSSLNVRAKYFWRILADLMKEQMAIATQEIAESWLWKLFICLCSWKRLSENSDSPKWLYESCNKHAVQKAARTLSRWINMCSFKSGILRLKKEESLVGYRFWILRFCVHFDTVLYKAEIICMLAKS